MSNTFQTETPNIDGNNLLREPQKETYAALKKYAGEDGSDEREVGIVLPPVAYAFRPPIWAETTSSRIDNGCGL